MSLEGKVSLVTGASSGIGRAIALALAREGTRVAVNYKTNREGAKRVEKEIRAMGGESLVVGADVSRSDQVEEMVEKVERGLGEIDILVNNAGIAKMGKVEEITEEDWDEVLDVNLKGTFLCCRAVIGGMKRRRNGKIVNISSTAAKIGGTNSAASYAAAKAGVSCFTIHLAKEVLPYNICVNAVAPGGIDTPLLDMYGPKGK
ncbi:MAG: SDR family NAD(P)-dependent oxidoreductase, partial [Deltaproteobacteria bacterium]|nr:SDR family NAD(P)-dependent oxidoreductase [Deltaproteobacteria bacterium]